MRCFSRRRRRWDTRYQRYGYGHSFKTLANTPDTKEALWSKVQETYTKKGYTIADAILNARLTRILREGDYDYNTGEVKL